MKVLFAVSNENISTQIVKRYQKEYKEIISYKNMYYFNAIVKELQRDKTYDRIVISEDLEPFANNNFDEIEKFLFEKLDNITDEATGLGGKDIPIILLAADNRRKSEEILVKLFGIGIYNVLLGQDRSTEQVCNLLKKPRGKKEAKLYYKIETEEVSYKSESENNVSEAEIKNILNHYRRLGADEERYIESFNNIAAQYNDAQLRIITKFLPLNVKAVLEEQSPKYQSVMTFSDNVSASELMKKKKEEEGLKVGFLNYTNSNKSTKPVIVPTAVKKVAVKRKLNNQETKNKSLEEIEEPDNQEEKNIFEDFEEIVNSQENAENAKRGRGRPKKVVSEIDTLKENTVKRGRGRPKKIVNETEKVMNDLLSDFEDVSEKEGVLPGFDDIEEKEDVLPGFDDIEEKEDVLPGFDDIEEKEDVLPGFDDIEEKEDILPGFDDIEEKEDVLPGFDDIEEKDSYKESASYNNYKSNEISNYNSDNNENYLSSNMTQLLTSDKKVVSFVGTTKNGTSFLVNNLAKCLSSMGIKTAILDLTLNRNAYYIYTKNEEELRSIAYDSIKRLKEGILNGIAVDKYLDVYTSLPGDKFSIDEAKEILSTLAQNYSVVLMDCDFNTPDEYFRIAKEIYIVQTMDIFTIQPMTAFLRDLKAKDILDQEKIKVIINKEMKVKGLTSKVIIGGLSNYNDPAMAFMTELFDKDNIKYCTIPFDMEVCSKYLEGVMNCEVTINGYSKTFNTKLKELANMVYPLVGNKNKMKPNYPSNSGFSENMNNTLEQMKNRY